MYFNVLDYCWGLGVHHVQSQEFIMMSPAAYYKVSLRNNYQFSNDLHSNKSNGPFLTSYYWTHGRSEPSTSLKYFLHLASSALHSPHFSMFSLMVLLSFSWSPLLVLRFLTLHIVVSLCLVIGLLSLLFFSCYYFLFLSPPLPLPYYLYHISLGF